MAPQIVRLRGEGSVVWEFELPLAEVYADQVRARRLTPEDDESREAVADLLAAAEPETVPESDEPPAEKTLAERIDAVSSHAEANALAAELSVEGFEPKKPALDAKRKALHEAAAAAQAEAE